MYLLNDKKFITLVVIKFDLMTVNQMTVFILLLADLVYIGDKNLLNKFILTNLCLIN